MDHQHNTPLASEWLMMCLPGGNGIHVLHQTMFTRYPTETITNAEFCDLLKRNYETMRWRPFLGALAPRQRKLKQIRFVKFQTKETPYGVPAPIEVKNSRCLPTGEEGWVCGAPVEAILYAEMTMLAGLKGELVRERLNIHKLVSRKLQDPMDPSETDSYGWGLYFVEEEYCKGWYKGVVLVGTSVFAYHAGVVFALVLAMAFGSTSLSIEEFGEFRVTFAVYCFAFAFHHLGAFRLPDEDIVHLR